MSSAEFRNATRREVDGVFEVVDTMTELRVGQLVDLSSTGLQVLCQGPLQEDALYQWRFAIPGAGGQPAREVECGIHVLWVSAEMPGRYEVGGRFIQISSEAKQDIMAWCEDGTGSTR